MTKKKIEFGDFQTPLELAQDVVRLVKQVCPKPSAILEPTCGIGNFLKASIEEWHRSCEYYGFDVNEEYICSLKKELAENVTCYLELSDFFTKDWKSFFRKKHTDWLIVGNPPWVTNSVLGVLKSKNLPIKSNFQKLNGFAAKTGKANFDIAEWILIKLIDSLQDSSACLAMLCKTATARKVLRYFWNKDANIFRTSIHKIDSAKHFEVSVDACLLITFVGGNKNSKDATVYSDLSFENKISHMGIIKDELIADIELYNKYKYIDGKDRYGWRSGLKHDAVKIMELEKVNDTYLNGYEETVKLEDEYIYPLLKSSDIANQRSEPRRYVIVTQKAVSANTDGIKHKAPNTWAYLEKYADTLDARKSIIYAKRAKFSIFGVGNYSFTPWKVAISGLYKNCRFVVIGSKDNKPIMVDDTCYFLPCHSEREATLICNMLNSKPCKEFIKSLIFFDAKRPINIDLLQRIDLVALAKRLNQQDFIEFVTPNLLSGHSSTVAALPCEV